MKAGRRAEHHFKEDREWYEALSHALDAGPRERAASGLARPELKLLSVSNSGHALEVELRFRADRRYCCCEPGCHVPTYDAAWWATVRARLAEVTDREPPAMTMTIVGVVEAGAELEVHRCFGIPLASKMDTYRHGPEEEKRAK